jgi:hypothetical protein
MKKDLQDREICSADFFVCANKKRRYRTKSGIFMGWAVML